jgi:hypothetical protein
MMKIWILLLPCIYIACGASQEEAQLHHNQIMVCQHRVIESFEQLDKSLSDSTGYRQLYWEYDSVHFFIRQMQNILDTIKAIDVGDSSFKMASRQFAQSALELHSQLYPPFLDAFRKYHALGSDPDSVAMVATWEKIRNHKNQMIIAIKKSQEEFVKKYNLEIYTSPQ